MCELKQFKCVNCGEPAQALFKSYGPSVLKLTNCDKCHGVVDKYVEYDPVIVMIDLVLMSKEAQRHVIYNTEFKVYWKLFIILMMLETYGVWRNDSLISFGIGTMCNDTNALDITPYLNTLELQIPEIWKSNCAAWTKPAKHEDNDLFIWEKDFYIQFISTFCGIAAFIATTYFLMGVVLYLSKRSQVPFETQLKAFSLAVIHSVFVLPTLVWGAESPKETRAFHHILVALYGAAVLYYVYNVVYRCRAAAAAPVLAASYCAKFLVSYNAMPYVREVVK